MDNNIRLAAVAYYNNSSNPELKQLAWEFFQSIDTDRDGRVSFHEFMQFIHRSGYNWVVDSNFFGQLDVNRDGSLDFAEFLTFYYVLKTRNVWCADRRVNLSGLYFTCVECFDSGLDTFDVCAPCYSANRFCHHHGRDQFLDSFVLLRSKRGVSHVKHSNMALTQPPQNHSILNGWFLAMELALSVGNFVGCNIM
ncbi:hypothetical protein FEM48_Zijuj07G0088300 [Ziziphus jujuba var. spinosa]|uniref:EF-hand domain-containing protein n=1 Tax=Ziziphus jujuba var. spinosa TaxID=714518 RepID=A0A978V3N6_ZIZJJ|nr:hypothetical protein FEM48_Zijuj07G0088300 [Ziziphus jujuba var. spinosa]